MPHDPYLSVNLEGRPWAEGEKKEVAEEEVWWSLAGWGLLEGLGHTDKLLEDHIKP